MSVRIALFITALGLTSACMETQTGVSTQGNAGFDAAVKSVDCKLVGESDYIPVEFQTGLTREQVLSIVSTRLSTGRAVRLPGGGVKFTSGGCA